MDETNAVMTPAAEMGSAETARKESIRTGGRGVTSVPQRVPLGMELPLFCERCGYSLNALPQVRCEHCSVLQFHCPECGHHQPINSLRPGVQRTVGRLRALLLGLLAFFKLNWFGWHAFFWVVMGYEWAFSYNYRIGGSQALRPDLESVMGFGIYGFIVGFVSRLLLLRWRSGVLVGVVLGSLFATALVFGFSWRVSNSSRYNEFGGSVLTLGRFVMTLFTFAVILGAAAAAWPMWTGFVRLVLPERAGSALLEWQRSLSAPVANEAPQACLSDQP